MNEELHAKARRFAVTGSDVRSDEELVKAARAGDVTAFEALYRQHSGRIHGLCLRMVRDPDRAADLTQDAFVRAWEKLASFRGESGFGTWLHRLAVNVVLGDLRSPRHRERTEEETVEEASAPPRAGEARIDLARAVGQLPPKARAVFLLYDVEGYRHQEIAELAGISEGTSKAHLHRARRILRKVLEQ